MSADRFRANLLPPVAQESDCNQKLRIHHAHDLHPTRNPSQLTLSIGLDSSGFLGRRVSNPFFSSVSNALNGGHLLNRNHRRTQRGQPNAVSVAGPPTKCSRDSNPAPHSRRGWKWIQPVQSQFVIYILRLLWIQHLRHCPLGKRAKTSLWSASADKQSNHKYRSGH